MTTRPRALLIGDSISMGYTPHVAELLDAEAEVRHNPGNASDTDNTLASLDDWLAEMPADVVRQSRDHQVPLERYRANLARIVDRLKRTGAALIWASTTPVIDDRHQAVKDFDRYNRDVEAYNAAAGEVMAAAGVPTDDLHAAALTAGIEAVLTPDGVHFTDQGYRMLAEVVADCLRRYLR